MGFTREMYKLRFEISPVILCEDIAQAILGGILPIVALTQSASFVTGLLGGAINLIDLDKYFCHWKPIQGTTIVDCDTVRYPFASQIVAANALLAQSLCVTLEMKAPANENIGTMTKLVAISALQSVLQAYANLGGTFIIATPSVIYNRCILRTVKDVTSGNNALPQLIWMWDSEQPLITKTGAEQAVNNFLGKIGGGGKVTESAWTSTVNALGNTSLGGSVSEAITGLLGKLGVAIWHLNITFL